MSQSLKLPANYSTVVARAQLARRLHELAIEEEAISKKLVFEQHLQQQGWSAVIANMEDLSVEFRKRFDDFYRSFEEHQRSQTELDVTNYLTCYRDAIATLDRIIVSPCLLTDSKDGFTGFDELLGGGGGVAAVGPESLNGSANRPPVDAAAAAASSSVGSNNLDVATTTTTTDVSTKDSSGAGSVGTSRASSEQPSTDDSAARRYFTLLNWLTVRKTSVNDMANNCAQTIHMLNAETVAKLRDSIDASVRNINQVCLENFKKKLQ